MKKVLLASASKVFLRRNSNLLMKRGFQLFTSLSGAEALNLHQEHHFDLILADFRLEDMGGCTFCNLLHKDEKSLHVPVILTCHNIESSIERAGESGASAILLKPIDPMQLLGTLGNLIGLQLGRSKRVVLRVNVFSKDQILEFTCLSHDISTTGILLETDHQLALKSRIICRFSLPENGHIEADGQVIRCMSGVECENLYGVKFIALPLSSRRAIDDYIASTADNPATVQPVE